MILLLFYIFHVHLKLRIHFSRKCYIWTYNLCALYSRHSRQRLSRKYLLALIDVLRYHRNSTPGSCDRQSSRYYCSLAISLIYVFRIHSISQRFFESTTTQRIFRLDHWYCVRDNTLQACNVLTV